MVQRSLLAVTLQVDMGFKLASKVNFWSFFELSPFANFNIFSTMKIFFSGNCAQRTQKIAFEKAKCLRKKVECWTEFRRVGYAKGIKK